ncbi:hypothetical protein DRW41_13375 [Neobacillus piezotolerans]|uniref:Uncharacterized protein n=1 Tax=Neobacillus piezotolerans TaxID=2259171 RepID=A0A3D8GPU4_9BACI|nr:hypothetical protein [Neobacillus piezotolerans]RDU36515.1 hypothetical protein DRW41_13375 [Neobacillus piezotolerans]
MRLVSWAYTKKYNIKALFDEFPSSTVIFRQIKEYYFIYTIKWHHADPPVKRADLEEMERLLNLELGTYEGYLRRKVFHPRENVSGLNRE